MSAPARLPYGPAMVALGRCVGRTSALIASRNVHQPTTRVGQVVHFADGTAARIYRETAVDGRGPAVPCVLVVAFRLRWINGWGHRVFRAESLLNTPLFVGFPGFVSKLWLAADQNSVYRGIYQWDGADRAEAYVATD